MKRHVLLLAAVTLFGVGCGGSDSSSGYLKATIGTAGGALTGTPGSDFDGVNLVIPAGALSKDTEISIKKIDHDTTALPATATQCGQEFSVEPAGLALGADTTLTLPFDPAKVDAALRNPDEVKVWVDEADKFVQRLQLDGDDSHVTIALPTTAKVAAGVNPPADVDVIRFSLHPNPKFLPCLAEYPSDPNRAPSADVTVVRGELNDTLRMQAHHLKKGLEFDLFTVESSQLQADGTVDPAFTNFGMAWYQSDFDARDNGNGNVTVRSIFLDQIFGFDPRAPLAPTQTFHVGFWFNDPNDAAACGFDVTKPTPFNGEHKAGPLAMITVPDATTTLGPLCTKPDTSTSPAHCDP